MIVNLSHIISDIESGTTFRIILLFVFAAQFVGTLVFLVVF